MRDVGFKLRESALKQQIPSKNSEINYRLEFKSPNKFERCLVAQIALEIVTILR